MSRIDDLSAMIRNHPFALHLRSLRHRPYFRPVSYGVLFFTTLYALSHVMFSSDAPRFAFSGDQKPLSPKEWEDRAMAVKRAFQHAYHGYETHAAPHDELRPLSGVYIDNFNGWGVSVFDSLDTMLLLGLNEEFKRALPLVEKVDFSMEEGKFAPYFETTIRYLGGLLSAYAISGETMLLNRADELAQKLDPVFRTESGFPLYGVNPSSRAVSGPEVGILAEIASLQMEYTYLAKATGKKEYFDRANIVIQALADADLHGTGGMFPIGWNVTSAQPVDYRLSVGAQADSAHEYLLKQYLLTAKTDKRNLEMYICATTHILTTLMFLSPTRHLLYVTDSVKSPSDPSPHASRVFEHLSCFFPGLLTLGARSLPLDDLGSMGIDLEELAARGNFGEASREYKLLKNYNLKELHQWAAEGLAQSCWLSYADQPTGLGPDEMLMKTEMPNAWGGKAPEKIEYLWIEALEKWRKSGARGIPPGLEEKKPVVYSEWERLHGSGKGRDYAVKKNGYVLRPETLESLYLLWRTTGDSKWRERGWQIFEAIEEHCKTPIGYASLRSVEHIPAPKADDMPSYVFAETFKYLYLMFLKEDPIDLGKWVFNTEAHPLPIFEWSARERELFNI